MGAFWKLRDYLGLFLRQDSGEGLVTALGRNLELVPMLAAMAEFALGGALVALAATALRSRWGRRPPEEAAAEIASAFVVLLVPAGLVLAASASLIASPEFPYGLNLAVSLAMEGSFFELLAAGLLLASLVRSLTASSGLSPRELPRGRLFGAAVVLAGLVAFTLATPARFYEPGVGQGNMFKYLRMASAAAGSGTLDIAQADTRREATLSGFLAQVPRLARSYLAESRELAANVLGAAARGELYRGELTATRANRSMFRSAAGGVYYINAPGPGLMLVPAYLLDRKLEAWLGIRTQAAVIVFWQLVGALLVYQIVLAATEIAGRSAALLVAAAVGLTVPVLFYTFQIYPELPGGLALIVAFRKLVLDPAPSSPGVLAAGLALAAAPWLHQKYSVVAAVLGLYGAYRLFRLRPLPHRERGLRLALLLAPMALSAYSIFLYNHALTGSLSPTATFDAAGRSSFEPWSFPKGFLGLLLDRDNGLFVFAPVYLLALAGFSSFAREQRRLLAPFAIVVFSYLLVIASFPYWPGAVSTMGRYILSILPLLALPAALGVRRALSDGLLAGLAVVLAAASLAYTVGFALDLVPSYQPMLLWSRALYSDPTQYLPSFLGQGALGSGPAHAVKILVPLALLGAITFAGSRRAGAEEVPFVEPRHYGRRLAAGSGALLLAVLALAALLERWPGNASGAVKPLYRDRLVLHSGATISVRGEHGFEGRGFWIAGGDASRLLVVSREDLGGLDLLFSTGPEGNRVVVRERRSAPMEVTVPPGGPHRRSVLLRKPYRFDGPRGERFVYRLELEAERSFVPKEAGTSEDERELGVYVGVR